MADESWLCGGKPTFGQGSEVRTASRGDNQSIPLCRTFCSAAIDADAAPLPRSELVQSCLSGATPRLWLCPCKQRAFNGEIVGVEIHIHDVGVALNADACTYRTVRMRWPRSLRRSDMKSGNLSNVKRDGSGISLSEQNFASETF